MIWVILFVLAVGFALPFVIERRRPKMGPEAREIAPGEFAELSDGITHFKWYGPKDGPVLVCVHGLTTPSYVWLPLIPGLIEAGFRVLTYDLYGRGFSDRPKDPQTREFFIRQLNELLQHQGVEGPINVMGYSMGGSVATVFAAADPSRIQRLILLAPAGMMHVPGWLSSMARKLPVLGDWLALGFAGWQLQRGAEQMEGPADVIAEMADRQGYELGFRGYMPAVLSSQRYLLATPLEAEHRALAAAGLPVYAIWGQEDSVIPIAAMGKLAEWNRAARQASVPGAEHGLGYTHPTEVIEALADVLSDG